MYFENIPDFLYPDFKVAGKYKLTKNIFRRIRARDSFNVAYASSTPYTIQENETPDSIAYKEYGDSEWFWTILIINNIVNIGSMWPLSTDELDKYIDKKYGDYQYKDRHWETTEIRDSKNNVVIEGGVIVEMFQDLPEQSQVNYSPKIKKEYVKYVSSFSPRGSNTITLGSIENLNVGDNLDILPPSKITSINGNTVTIDNQIEYDLFPQYQIKFSRYENWTMKYIFDMQTTNGIVTSKVERIATSDTLAKITNRDYEYALNELKREIKLPDRRYLRPMEQELIKLMEYDTTYKITREGYRLSEEI